MVSPGFSNSGSISKEESSGGIAARPYLMVSPGFSNSGSISKEESSGGSKIAARPYLMVSPGFSNSGSISKEESSGGSKIAAVDPTWSLRVPLAVVLSLRKNHQEDPR